ncbi:MAG: hypothetical protein ACOYN0_02340 [Phycisphaerales bacterium]
MFQHIRTITIVTLVTLLIWVFAESETLQPAERSTQVVFRIDPVGNKVLGLLGPDGEPLAAPSLPVTGPDGAPLAAPSLPVTMWVEGPLPAIESLDEVLRQGSVEIAYSALDLELSTGARDVRLVDAFRQSRVLSNIGVTVLRTDPEFVRVRMEELVSRRLRVEVPTTGGESDGLPETRPADIEVTMTKAQSDALDPGAVAVARIDPAIWSKLLPGKRETVAGVRVELPPALSGKPHVRASPAAVDVTLTLRSKTANAKLDSVPVALRLAPEEFGKWNIDVPESDRFLTDVIVNGPAEYVAAIAGQRVQLVAVVSLTFEELEKRISTKEAVFVDIPPGVKVDVANRTVRLSISPREPVKKAPEGPSGKP